MAGAGRRAPHRRDLAVAADAASARIGARAAIGIRAAGRRIAIAAGAADLALRPAALELGIGVGPRVPVGVAVARAGAVAGPVADRREVGIGDAGIDLRLGPAPNETDRAAGGRDADDALHERTAIEAGSRAHGDLPLVERERVSACLRDRASGAARSTRSANCDP